METLRKTKMRKKVGAYHIPMKNWEYLGGGLNWLIRLFNVIYFLRTIKTSKVWRISTIVPSYKNKGNIQLYTY